LQLVNPLLAAAAHCIVCHAILNLCRLQLQLLNSGSEALSIIFQQGTQLLLLLCAEALHECLLQGLLCNLSGQSFRPVILLSGALLGGALLGGALLRWNPQETRILNPGC
jgi:hypothetical protein